MAAMVETKNIKSLGKLVSVLDCFSTTDRSLTVSKIAERAGLPRSTAHRAILALKEVGFLEQDHTRDEYRLGLRLFQLGATVLNNMDLQRVAHPFVEALSALVIFAVFCIWGLAVARARAALLSASRRRTLNRVSALVMAITGLAIALR